MAGSLNKVSLLGNVGKDPEIRNTQSGDKIGNLTLATSESWTDKASGEKKERTEWHRVVCFNDGLNGVIEKYVKKGSKIYVEGALQTRKWTDKDGIERYSTEVVLSRFNGTLILCGDRASGGSSEPARQAAPAAQRPAAGPSWDQGGSTGANLDDEIPFSAEWR
jgi:single-strand DNA-binding protein